MNTLLLNFSIRLRHSFSFFICLPPWLYASKQALASATITNLNRLLDITSRPTHGIGLYMTAYHFAIYCFRLFHFISYYDESAFK